MNIWRINKIICIVPDFPYSGIFPCMHNVMMHNRGLKHHAMVSLLIATQDWRRCGIDSIHLCPELYSLPQGYLHHLPLLPTLGAHTGHHFRDAYISGKR